MNDRLKIAVDSVLNELARAQAAHKPMTGWHYAKAVIEEELDEMWDAIKADNPEEAYHECHHVAAMALRALVDLDPQKMRLQ